MTADEILTNCHKAKLGYNVSTAVQRNKALELLAIELNKSRGEILLANNADVMDTKDDRNEAFIDRMRLDDEKIDAMIAGIEQIIKLSDIIGRVYDHKKQKSGIETSKMTIPLGVIFMIYESRPNVTVDAAALAIKTANVIILKGGKETINSNKAIERCLKRALDVSGLDKNSVTILLDDQRQITDNLLGKPDDIDLVIPRGSRRLLEYVQQKSRIPTLLHIEGNCHIYVDESADLSLAKNIIVDAKTQRAGTCNAVESLLVHKSVATKLLPSLSELLSEAGVEIRGDNDTKKIIPRVKLAKNEDWSTEYLDKIISCKIVESLEEAVLHINTYGSDHSDGIIVKNQKSKDIFLKSVDSSSVMVNTSTRLADGFEYGLGAEIGISTGKLHARGPVGQDGLTTYKWIVESDGVTKGDKIV